MKARLTTVSLAALTALLVVWGVLVSFDWMQEYFATKQNPAYQELPFEFKLKVDPEDVIFSEANETGDGKDVVEYAYIVDEAGPQLNEDIQRRTPNSYTEIVNQFKDEEGKPIETLKTTFLPKPQFYQKDGQWLQVEYATTTPEIFAMSGAIPHIKKRELVERLLPGKPVFAAVSTFYPDPNTETSSVDGYVEAAYTFDNNNVDTACSQAKFIGTKTANDSGTIMNAVGIYQATDNSPILENFGEDEYSCTIMRAFTLFDTSSLPNDATISATTLALYVTAKWDVFLNEIGITGSYPASNTAIASSDFGLVYSSDYATRVAISSISTSAYNTFTFNSTGRGQVSLTGVSKFSVRIDGDIDDFYSTLMNGSETVGIQFSSAEATGTSQDPKLEVTYTVPSTFSMGQWFPF